MHVAPAASVAGPCGHVFVCAKSLAFVPATPIAPIVSGALPVFVRVVDFAVLVVPTVCDENVRVVGVRPTAGAETVPVPESATVCGLPAASSATVSEATRLPLAVGANVTEIEQLEPAARAAGQALTWP